METGLLVGDAMTKRPITVPKNLTVRECARIMTEKSVGSVLVTEDDDLLGIITEEDIISKVTMDAKDPEVVTCNEIMTSALLTIDPNSDILRAINVMKDNDIRHLPVLNKDKLVGFLTIKDVLKIEPQLFELMLETMELREESRKLSLRPNIAPTEGFCEVCGNFAEHLSRNEERRMACSECLAE